MKIKYNLCRPIPRELRVRGADSHMYSIGFIHIEKFNYYQNHVFITKTIRELNAIYIEINEYNRNYWSKYLLAVWATISFLNCYIIHLVIISNSHYLIKLIAFLTLVVFLSQLLFIIHISSQLYNQAKYSYILFNSYVSHTKKISIIMKLKVFLVYIYV